MKLASNGAYSVVWTRRYTIDMSNAILPHTMAVFAIIGSTLVYCSDLPPTHDAKKYYVLEGWNGSPATSIIHAVRDR